MNTAINHRRLGSQLPMLVATGALALLGTAPVLAGASGLKLKEVIEIGQQHRAEQRQQQREQQRARPEQQRPTREAPPRSQPGRPPGGNFAGTPRPPRENDGNANHNRPPPPYNGGNWSNGGNRSNSGRWSDDGRGRPDHHPPPQDNGWRPGYNRPPDHAGRPGHRPPPRPVPSLPSGYASHYWNGSPYYHAGGHWYRPWGSSFVVVTAPYGMFVPYLSGYYSTIWYGGSRYFLADNTYYLFDDTRRGYVVTPSPYGDEQEGAAGSAADEQLYVYPASGQSEQQTANDRYECHRWAVDQTAYDPVDSDYDANRREQYLRALTACLTGRGYTVG